MAGAVMSEYIAAFPILSAASVPEMKRQALYQLADLIPDGVKIKAESWRFSMQGQLPGVRWLIARAPAEGDVDVAAIERMANAVRADAPMLAQYLTAQLEALA